MVFFTLLDRGSLLHANGDDLEWLNGESEPARGSDSGCLFCSIASATQPISLGGDGAWDYLKADVEARRLYVSHSGEVVVLDLDSQKRLGTLSGFGFIHGILVAEKLNTGFLSDGQKNEVVTFDPRTLTITGRLKTAANPKQYGLRRDHGTNLCGP